MNTSPAGDESEADPVAVIADLFAREGAEDYFGEPVSQAEHMLQTAALARAARASDALVAAALLHDVGHFHGTHTGADLMRGTDNHHSEAGADWLRQWFGPSVTEPIRLHVAAKRYLCAVDPGYLATLSPASLYTLGVQGGPMTPEAVRRFREHPRHADAVALRLWDDQAKDPELTAPAFDTYRDLLHVLLSEGDSRS
ncbi:MAG TPA: HD domain-containing protein [Pseudonocardia sp.]